MVAQNGGALPFVGEITVTNLTAATSAILAGSGTLTLNVQRGGGESGPGNPTG